MVEAGWMLHDLDNPSVDAEKPVNELLFIAAINQNFLQAREFLVHAWSNI